MAEAFTGTPGVYVPIEDTVRSFKEIIEGKHDDLPERAFLLKGAIDDVVGAARGESDEEEESEESEKASGGGESEDSGESSESEDDGEE